MKFKFTHTGDFKRTTKFLERVKEIGNSSVFNKYGEIGVKALSEATPVRTGLTAESWEYNIEHNQGSTVIYWKNTNVNRGVPIAVILQYGHGTGTGGWVQGIDYINPALAPVFQEIADGLWKEVTSS